MLGEYEAKKGVSCFLVILLPLGTTSLLDVRAFFPVVLAFIA